MPIDATYHIRHTDSSDVRSDYISFYFETAKAANSELRKEDLLPEKLLFVLDKIESTLTVFPKKY